LGDVKAPQIQIDVAGNSLNYFEYGEKYNVGQIEVREETLQ